MLGSTPPGEGRNRTTDHGSKANPADPHLRQDPAFRRRCLSKCSLQELFIKNDMLSR